MLRVGNCKVKTKNESRLKGLQNSKNKISEPAIVTRNTEVINILRINNWLSLGHNKADLIMMNDSNDITPMSLLFYQYTVLRAMQLPVMQFALFPFAFVFNVNLFPNAVTDKIKCPPLQKKQTNKQSKTKEEKKNNNKKRPLKQCKLWTLHSEFCGISCFPLFIEKTTIIHCANSNFWHVLCFERGGLAVNIACTECGLTGLLELGCA